MSSFSDAVVAARYQPYDTIALTVNLPPVFLPLVRLQPHEVLSFDEPYPEPDFEAFMRESRRITAEHTAITMQALYAWRHPTVAERQRLDELVLEHDIAVATLQRTRASSN